MSTFQIKYAPALTNVLERYEGAKRHLFLECALDKAYYEELLKSSDSKRYNFSLVYDLAREDIDKNNFMTGLRLVRAGVSPDEGMRYFIPGGHKIRERQFEELINSSSLEDAFEYLRGLSYGDILDSRWALYEKIDDISVFERSLEEGVTRWLYRLVRRSPMGFGVVLGYLRLKYTEMLNLRVIARCKEFGVPEEIVKGELTYVYKKY